MRRDRHARERPRAGLRVLGALVLQPDRELLAGGHALEQLDVLRARARARSRSCSSRAAGRRSASASRRPSTSPERAISSSARRSSQVRASRATSCSSSSSGTSGASPRRHVEQEEELRRGVLDEREVVLDRLGLEARREQLLQADAQLGRHAVAGHGDHHRDVAAGGVAAHRERDALRLLGARRRDDLGAQRLDRRLEELVARERLERGDGRLVVVRALDQALGLDDRLQLAAQQRRARGLLEVDQRREQADHAQQARERAVGAQHAHRDVVHARAPVDARAAVGLADHEQVAVGDEALAQELGQLRERRRLGEARRLVVAQDAEPRAGLRVHRGAARGLRDLVGARAEQDEVAVAQPVQERRPSRRPRPASRTARRPAPPRPCARPSRASPRSRRRRACSSASASRTAATSASPSSGVSAPLELEPHDRLAAARLARVGDAHDAPGGVALDADDRMQQQAHACARRPGRPRARCRRGTARRAR